MKIFKKTFYPLYPLFLLFLSLPSLLYSGIEVSKINKLQLDTSLDKPSTCDNSEFTGVNELFTILEDITEMKRDGLIELNGKFTSNRALDNQFVKCLASYRTSSGAKIIDKIPTDKKGSYRVLIDREIGINHIYFKYDGNQIVEPFSSTKLFECTKRHVNAMLPQYQKLKSQLEEVKRVRDASLQMMFNHYGDEFDKIASEFGFYSEKIKYYVQESLIIDNPDVLFILGEMSNKYPEFDELFERLIDANIELQAIERGLSEFKDNLNIKKD